MTKNQKTKNNHRTVMIGTPTLDGKVWLDYMNSYVHSIVLAANAGWATQINGVSGCSLINYARSLIGQDFMESDCDCLFFIDSDLRWDPRAFVRMLECDRDLVGGVYPCRFPGKLKFPTRGLFNGHEYLMTTKGLQGGFIRITRRAIEKMRDAYPELLCSHRGRQIYMLWEPMIREGEPLGEDFSFCQRWIDIGGKVFIDPDINFGHMGMTVYEGNLKMGLETWKGPRDGYDLHDCSVAEHG